MRRDFDVSTEAVLIRLAHLSEEPCAVFVASRQGDAFGSDPSYVFDYVIPSRTWKYPLNRAVKLAHSTPVAECTAVGFTAKGDIELPDVPERLHLECIGIPPYPGATFPRVAGFLSSRKGAQVREIEFLKGNVLQPRGHGRRIIGHVVSDATPNWGGHGVAIAIKKKWPSVQTEFRNWFVHRRGPRLGDIHVAAVAANVEIASMVCQHGYGPSQVPRLRYAALETALEELSQRAIETNATVHIPRIGCGQAGGSWMLVRELIETTLLAANVSVTVYDLPQSNVSPGAAQLSFA
jgi:hypothetical protein